MTVSVPQAITILNRGGIILYPTDTAYAIGCRIDRKESIKRLFEVRKRPVTKATPVLFESIERVRAYVTDIPEAVEGRLMNIYWPGALTIILPANETKVPEMVRDFRNTVGVRIPNNTIARDLIAGVDSPLIGTSANFHGDTTPYAVSDLNPELIALVDGVIEGECSVKRESTVIDCSINPWKILRQGAVTIQV